MAGVPQEPPQYVCLLNEEDDVRLSGSPFSLVDCV